MSVRRFQQGKRYWWMQSRKSKSKSHRKAHVKGPSWEHVMNRNRPKGPL